MNRVSIFSPEFRPTLKIRGMYYLRLMFISLFLIWIPLCLFYGAVYKRITFAHLIKLSI
ncbi:hypothetical protein LPJ81_007000, partial [Coemansia sp. IMI 209127]